MWFDLVDYRKSFKFLIGKKKGAGRPLWANPAPGHRTGGGNHFIITQLYWNFNYY